jgi:DNA-directed RNA polymerase subunit H (RpoH/RPB5)
MEHKYLRASKTLLELAQDRGFPIYSTYVNQDIFRQKYDYFKQNEYSDVLDLIVRHPTNKRLLLCFFRDLSFDEMGKKRKKQKNFEQVNTNKKINELMKARVSNIIMEYKVTPRDQILIIYNDYIIKTEDFLGLTKNNLRFYKLSHLQFNVGRHKLVPKHEPISPYEEMKMIRNYKIQTKRQLPFLNFDDPQALYYGFRVGSVVKITRNTKNAGQSVSYRYVASEEVSLHDFASYTETIDFKKSLREAREIKSSQKQMEPVPEVEEKEEESEPEVEPEVEEKEEESEPEKEEESEPEVEEKEDKPEPEVEEPKETKKTEKTEKIKKTKETKTTKKTKEKVCAINETTGKCSTKGTETPEKCEMGNSGRCKKKKSPKRISKKK